MVKHSVGSQTCNTWYQSCDVWLCFCTRRTNSRSTSSPESSEGTLVVMYWSMKSGAARRPPAVCRFCASFTHHNECRRGEPTQLKLNPSKVVNYYPNWTARALEDVLYKILEAMAEVLSSSDRVVAQLSLLLSTVVSVTSKPACFARMASKSYQH